MWESAGCQFSTYDKDNDEHETKGCAVNRTGAWWYKECGSSNLNGKYQSETLLGVRWDTWTGNRHSLKKVEMKTRRK